MKPDILEEYIEFIKEFKEIVDNIKMEDSVSLKEATKKMDDIKKRYNKWRIKRGL